MMVSICPICQVNVLHTELEWHANNHFLEDDFEKDMQLAKHVSLELLTSTIMDEPSSSITTKCARNSALILKNHLNGSREAWLQDRISCLKTSQTKGAFYEVKGSIMTLLERCLQLENENQSFRSIISGYIDHYQTVVLEDNGWGCGWRNIQMLSSHLLMQRKEAKDILFGGCEFVPDIPSLQRWLEIAWERGFDVPGSLSFDKEVYGSKKWIGATECVALFRSFGLRVRVVDFDGLPPSSSTSSLTSKNSKHLNAGGDYIHEMLENKVYGPMDKFLQRRTNEEQGNTLPDHNNVDERTAIGHQVLMEWVWNYFKSGCLLDDFHNVFVSPKTPLYFQHDGHSRTVIGIQMQRHAKKPHESYSLLILDPAQRTKDIEKTLRDNNGWQRLLKRGIHTLKKPQYQLCYIDSGISDKDEWEDLKTICSQYIRL